MKPSLRAALLNALIFPGVGHIYLKRAARGCLFLLPALVALLYFLNQVMERANAIAGQVMAGTMPLDPVLIAARIEESSGNSTLMTSSVYVIVVCWAASIVDGYLLGRSMP
jgi:hypothetical protein